MRDLIVIEYMSVDGVAQAPGHATEDTEGDFERGGWSEPSLPDHRDYMNEALNIMGALLLGRVTYDIWVTHWPNVTDPGNDIARMLNTVPKYVASRNLRSGTWAPTTVIRDIPAEVAELKEEPGKAIVVMGSTRLVHALTEHHLIDEYRLLIHPVVLGQGKRVFPLDGPGLDLALTNASVTRSGLATLTYRRPRTSK